MFVQLVCVFLCCYMSVIVLACMLIFMFAVGVCGCVNGCVYVSCISARVSWVVCDLACLFVCTVIFVYFGVS